jgi:hypothetical protein
MSKRDDGGPAFPMPSESHPQDGMTLRDYFAAKAMQALIAAKHDAQMRGYERMARRVRPRSRPLRRRNA